jgi:two-component system CheB/CheR fusion protein
MNRPENPMTPGGHPRTGDAMQGPPSSAEEPVARSTCTLLRRLAIGMTAVAAAIGALGLFGTFVDIRWLASVRSGLVAIKVNTAVAIVLAALSLGLQIERRPGPRLRVARACAGVVGAIGLLTLLEDLLGVDLGIDQLLWHEPLGAVGTVHPGRPAPNAALVLLLLGIALLVLDVETRKRRCPSQFLSIGAIAIAAVGFLGYVYGTGGLYAIGGYTPISLGAAVALALLGTGCLAARPDRGFMATITSRSAGGIMARRLLAAIVIAPVLLDLIGLVGVRRGLYDSAFNDALHIVTLTGTFLIFLWRNARLLNKLDEERSDSERQRFKLLVEEREAQARAEAERAARAEAERLARRLLNLQSVTDAALANLSAPDLARELLGRLCSMLGADAAVVLRPMGPDGELEVHAVQGEAVGGATGARIGLGKGMAGRIAARREPALAGPCGVEDLGDPLARVGCRSRVGVPLVSAEQVVGVLELGSRRDDHFDRADLELLEAAGQRIALAMDRAQEHHRAQTAHGKLRAMFEKAAVGIVELDAEDRLIAVNERFCKILGYGRDELLGTTVRGLTLPDDRASSDEVSARVKAGRDEVVDYESRYLRRDGTPVWVHVSVAGIRDGNAGFLGSIRTAEDISARKAAEAEREKLIQELHEADRRKSEFLGVLSHELRNPLSPIRSSIYILRRVPARAESSIQALAVLERQANQLTRLTDDLLDVTRISRGKIRLQRERVDLGELMARTADDYRELFATGGVELTVVRGDASIDVDVDPARLHQVLGNLLQNAAKFTPRGGRTTLSLERTGDTTAVITVRDTGVGIAEELLPHVFEPFMQAEKTLDRSAGGLGLGLALVKGLVELHGGSVGAQSEGAWKGATFTVQLPVERRKVPRFTVAAAPTDARPARRVLVIEDSIDAAQCIKTVLELNEHVVEVAYTGSAGIEKAHAFRPDVVLCDIGLPGMNGFEVARSMRSDPDLCTVPLIALTGYARAEDIERAMEAGFDVHLAKPPDFDVLEQTMAHIRAATA